MGAEEAAVPAEPTGFSFMGGGAEPPPEESSCGGGGFSFISPGEPPKEAEDEPSSAGGFSFMSDAGAAPAPTDGGGGGFSFMSDGGAAPAPTGNEAERNLLASIVPTQPHAMPVV